MNRGFEFNTPARIRITGYVDITAQEFQTHYEPALDECIGRGDTYILSDEAGLCQIALEYLTERGETERYEAMFDASDDKIIWLRADDGFEGISGSDALDMRFSGPQEAERVESSRYIQDAMDFYDTIA